MFTAQRCYKKGVKNFLNKDHCRKCFGSGEFVEINKSKIVKKKCTDCEFNSFMICKCDYEDYLFKLDDLHADDGGKIFEKETYLCPNCGMVTRFQN